MGIRDVADLEWEQLLQIHQIALEFYEADRALRAPPMMMTPPPDRTRTYSARELQMMQEKF
jgi:hypothetical protein